MIIRCIGVWHSPIIYKVVLVVVRMTKKDILWNEGNKDKQSIHLGKKEVIWVILVDLSIISSLAADMKLIVQNWLFGSGLIRKLTLETIYCDFKWQ